MTTKFALFALAALCSLYSAAVETDKDKVFSERHDKTVAIQPSGVTFTLPESWLKWNGQFKNNLHFTREELARVQDADEKCEWDHEYAKIVNALLPFDRCAFHGGGEGWGHDGVSFDDVQMRAYVGSWAPERLSKDIASKSPQLGAHKQSQEGPWKVNSLSTKVWYGDYGGVATVDIYSQKKDATTVVLVFMRSDYRGKQDAEIREVIDSFRFDAKPADSAPTSTPGK
jgi:hypothetical protein